MDELSEEDKLTVARARKIQRFLSQPFFVAEVFTGSPGQVRLVSRTPSRTSRPSSTASTTTCPSRPSTWSAASTRPCQGRADEPLRGGEQHHGNDHPRGHRERRGGHPLGQATMVYAPAEMGEVGIAPRHTAFISRLKPGDVRVENEQRRAGALLRLRRHAGGPAHGGHGAGRHRHPCPRPRRGRRHGGQAPRRGRPGRQGPPSSSTPRPRPSSPRPSPSCAPSRSCAR
jgi:hypothetical protein